jgi:hypothetical protein
MNDAIAFARNLLSTWELSAPLMMISHNYYY